MTSAFDIDDGVIVISSVPDFDKDAFSDFMVGTPGVTGVKVVVPKSTWLDSVKVAEISTMAAEHRLPVSFQNE
jgi:hypothetical protein